MRLVETLTVIAIISVLSVIAVPYLYGMASSLNYKEAAWGIASDMRLSRQLSMSNNLEHRVEFDFDGKRYRVARGNLPSGSTSWTEVMAWRPVADGVDWTNGSSCGGTGDLNVRFRPNGSAETAFICVKGPEGVKYRVSVNSTSGRAFINSTFTWGKVKLTIGLIFPPSPFIRPYLAGSFTAESQKSSTASTTLRFKRIIHSISANLL